MTPVIEIDHLTKYYGRREIIRDLSLKVPPGSIYGFLGRNGTGKTTTIRILLGFEEPTRGREQRVWRGLAEIESCNARAHRVPARRASRLRMDDRRAMRAFPSQLFPGLEVAGHFRNGHYALSPQSRHESGTPFARTEGWALPGAHACAGAGIAGARRPGTGARSGGAAQPVAIDALRYAPSGSDHPFSSHMLSDVERVADRIVVLDGGVLRADCAVEFFRERMRHYVLKFRETPPPAPVMPGLLESFRTDHELALTFANATPSIEEELARLQPESLDQVAMTLEDAFISYVGEHGEKTFFIKEKPRQ